MEDNVKNIVNKIVRKELTHKEFIGLTKYHNTANMTGSVWFYFISQKS